MGCGIFGAGIQGYIVHNASDTGYLGQKCTGYGTLRAPYQWGLLRVVSMWIFLSSWQGWEFVHDKIYNCILKVRITCIKDYFNSLLLLFLFLNLFPLKKEE